MNLLKQEINSMEELRDYRKCCEDILNHINSDNKQNEELSRHLINTIAEVDEKSGEILEKMYQAQKNDPYLIPSRGKILYTPPPPEGIANVEAFRKAVADDDLRREKFLEP